MNEIMKQEIANKIKEMRLSKKISQRELAERIGVTRSCYANYEQNTREISIEQLFMICDICGYDIDEVIADLRKYTYK